MTTPPLAPFSATWLTGCVLLMLGAIFLLLWRRDREAGMAGVGTGFVLLGLWYALSDRYAPLGPVFETPDARLWAIYVGIGVMILYTGVATYLCSPQALAWPWMLAIPAPSLVVVVLLSFGVPIPRALGTMVLLMCPGVTAVLALRRARAEPGAGHRLIALSLFVVSATPLVLKLLDLPPVLVRHAVILPTLLLALTLLTVSLRRRRRALEVEVARRAAAEAELSRINQGLEREVAHRTAELQGLVAGLEGFNRSVSHDLRGPLGGIAGLARVAHQRLLAGDPSLAQTALPAIATQAETSVKLVGALLALARVSDAEVVCRPVALDAMVQEVIAEIRLARPDTPHRFDVGRLPEVWADADLLRPVLVNLLGNAAKFSRGSAEPKVTIAAESTGDAIVVAVQDNGVGFDPAQAAALFQPFQRLHGTQFDGHGVGLSIVRRAVERQGGQVWAQSRPGEGATFSFSLPRAPATR